MINERRVKRIRAFLYTGIVVLLLLPIVLVVLCIRMLFVIGHMEGTMNTVADRVENAAVSIEASVKRSSLDNTDPSQALSSNENSSLSQAGTPMVSSSAQASSQDTSSQAQQSPIESSVSSPNSESESSISSQLHPSASSSATVSSSNGSWASLSPPNTGR